MSLLIIGGTGTLGRQIVKRALDEGYSVKCLVRNLRRGAFLKDWGAELVYGDLSVPETLPTTLKGINVVIDASTIRATDDYNADLIDWKGKVALIEAAKLAKVQKFIAFSFLGARSNPGIPLLDLKLKLIKALEKSKLNYTVFQCAGFFQGLINQYAVPLLDGETIWLVNGTGSTAYIDTQDAASIVIDNLGKQLYDQKNYVLKGPKAWRPEEIIQLCERLSGKTAKISYIPLFAITLLRKILRSFESTWNIADRLQFAELSTELDSKLVEAAQPNLDFNKLTLEQYLQEYFSRIIKKLKETNYQQSQQNKDISFL